MLGYEGDDLKFITIQDLLHPSDYEQGFQGEFWFDSEIAESNFTVRCKHKQGAYRWIRWHTHPGPGQALIYAVGVDVTVNSDGTGFPDDHFLRGTRKSADQILFEANPNPMWVYDLESLRFLEVNDAAIEHYGYSRSEFLSMTLLDIRPQADAKATRDWATKKPEDAPANWTHLHKSGKAMQVEVLVRNIHYRGYRARLATIKDVTEQLAARTLLQLNHDILEQRVAERTKQLVAANTELEAFCFAVSHDLRAPLRAIDGFSHSVLNHYGDLLGKEGKSDLVRVRSASQKMSELIDALLGLARLTRQELRLQEVDLSSVARLVNEEIQVENPSRRVQCRIQPEMKVIADPQLMHLMLRNLFSNAWKFTANQKRAEIVFESNLTGSERVFSIRDNGAGFDMAYLDKLFQPFQRLHHASEYPGNCVGLATVNRIVTRHGGKTFAHGLINQGATIYFTLGAPS